MSTDEKEQKRITRREFVRGAAVGAAGVAAAGALASCATATPEVITKEVIVTKEVPVTVEVEKQVVVEKEVIKEVPGPAGEAGPVTLEVFDPSGAFEVTAVNAPRLDTLEGKTICEVASYVWESERTLPLVQELLQKMYPTATIIPYTEMPKDSDLAAIPEAISEKGCDAVIIGNAG
jgi:hypothetical protein